MAFIKKIVIVLIIALMFVFFSQKKSEATVLTWEDYLSQPYLFCIERGASLNVGWFDVNHDYTKWGSVNISGLDVSSSNGGSSLNDVLNGKMAYMLYHINPGHVGEGSSSNKFWMEGSTKRFCDCQVGLWHFMNSWRDSVNSRSPGFFNGINIDGASGTLPGETETSLEKDGTTYAEALVNSRIVDNKPESKETAEAATGEIEVGPFNYSFPGEIIELKISGEKEGENFFTVPHNGISSGNDFSIKIPIGMNIKNISRVRVKVRHYGVIKINIDLYSNPEQQNLLNIVTRDSSAREIEETFNYDTTDFYGDVTVIKVDEADSNIFLSGVEFKVRNNSLGYVKLNSNGIITYVSSQNDGTTFITNSSGKFTIGNLRTGKYDFIEIKNPNEGYILKSKTNVNIVQGENNVTVTNSKDDDDDDDDDDDIVVIGGTNYVWLDKDPRNNLYGDPGDKLLDGIIVRLKEGSGATVAQTTTSGGSYDFSSLELSINKSYYMEFEYDGLKYESVSPNTGKDNGSKAVESSSERRSFNQGFAIIEGVAPGSNLGIARSGGHQLIYDKSGNTSTISNSNEFKMKSSTNNTGFNIIRHEQKLVGHTPIVETTNEDGSTSSTGGEPIYETIAKVVPNINLGLYLREQPDCSLTKDLDSIKVVINNKEFVYYYNQKSSVPYTRPMYQSDYNFVFPADNERELKVYVNYRITIKNKSNSLIVKINKVLDYYDSNYEAIAAGTSVNNGNISGNIAIPSSTSYDSKYKRIEFERPIVLSAQAESTFFVQFKLTKEKVKEIVEGNKDLSNVSEISSYSVYDSGGSVYAGIDKNSNPGNCIPGNAGTYEDDTAEAPGLKLEKTKEERLAEGIAFLDDTDINFKSGEVRLGSGKYEKGVEKGVNGVKVTYLEKNTGMSYEYVTGVNKSFQYEGPIAAAKALGDGEYYISGFIPGDYDITYYWNNDTVSVNGYDLTVQNYKGTIFKDSARYNNNISNKKWYRESDSFILQRNNDALDNWDRRLEIDAEIAYVDFYNYDTHQKNDLTSSVPSIEAGVEYKDAEEASVGKNYDYNIRYIDYGIVERPRQDLSIEKRMKKIKVTLANGQVIINATVNEDGTITGEKKYLVFMKPSPNTLPSNGFAKVELDNELLQGAVIEVEYEIKLINTSEIDYTDKSYYHFGENPINVVKIKPTGLMDYLDRNWSFEENYNVMDNDGWKIKSLNELKTNPIVSPDVYESTDSTINEKLILYTKELENTAISPINPDNKVSIPLKVSKALTSTEEIYLGNEIEIVKVTREFGSKLISVPGDYVPGIGENESDDSVSETIIVTPSTGANREYLIIIGLATSIFVILGVGIITIKRKVLDK